MAEIKAETTTFDGIKFYRYPDAENVSDRKYFRAFPLSGEPSVLYLHREIWKSVYGDIPEKCAIHHIDEDTLNNSIDNLECIHSSEHMSMHSKKWLSDPENRKRAMQHLEDIRPLAAEWHRSKEGRAWHSEHSRQIYANLQPVLHICEFCGDEYYTKSRSNNRFCSNNCKSAWRRKSKVDIVDRVCVVCGGVFSINKYMKTKTCSRKCGGKLVSDAMKTRHKKEKASKRKDVAQQQLVQ